MDIKFKAEFCFGCNQRMRFALDSDVNADIPIHV